MQSPFKLGQLENVVLRPCSVMFLNWCPVPLLLSLGAAEKILFFIASYQLFTHVAKIPLKPPLSRSEQDTICQWYPGVHQEECGQQVEGGSPPPLLCPGEAISGVLCPVLGSPVQEGWGTTGESPAEG